MRGVLCHLVYRDEHGAAQRRRAVIADIVTRQGEEFVRLDDGSEIRLDRLAAVDGRRV